MVHTATYIENNMGLEVEVTSYVKDKRKKCVLNAVLLWQITLSLQIINGFYGIRYWSWGA